MRDFSYEDFLVAKETKDTDLLAELKGVNPELFKTYTTQHFSENKSKVVLRNTITNEVIKVSGFDDSTDKHNLGLVDIHGGGKESLESELAKAFSGGKTVDVQRDAAALEKAKAILTSPDAFNKNLVGISRAIVEKSNQRLREQASANPLPPQIGRDTAPRPVTKVVDTRSDSRKNAYLTKAPRNTALTNLNFSKHDIIQELKGKVARQANIKALVSTEFFTKGKLGAFRGLNSVGRASIFDKVDSLINAQSNMYLSYVNGLSQLLDNPNFDVHNPHPNISVKMGFIGTGRRNFSKNYTANVTPNWEALRERTLAEKASGESAPTFWKHKGKLAKAYKNNLAQHLRKVTREDFFDYQKMVQSMTNFRSQAQHKALLNEGAGGNYGNYGARQDSVTFTLDLAIPKWRASNAALMDDLVTQPYNNPFDHPGSRHNTTGGLGAKVSRHFRVLKKNKEYYQDFTDRIGKSELDPRGEMNPHILKGGNSESDLDKKYAPHMTVKELRSAFYNLRNVGGKEVGVRRFINPEFRRPFVQKLSHAAGVQARQAMKDLLDKNMP